MTATTESTAPTPNVTLLTRVFRFGSIDLPDPAPEKSPEDALRLYAPNYPVLASATVGESFIEGDLLVTPVEKPEVRTKG